MVPDRTWAQINRLKSSGRKFVIVSLSASLNMCYVYSKEPSPRDRSFEYPLHIFWLRNKKMIFNYAFLSEGLIVSNSH